MSNCDSYFDIKDKENNLSLGKTYADDHLPFVNDIHAVLPTCGSMGTYLYVSRPALRANWMQDIPAATNLMTGYT